MKEEFPIQATEGSTQNMTGALKVWTVIRAIGHTRTTARREVTAECITKNDTLFITSTLILDRTLPRGAAVGVSRGGKTGGTPDRELIPAAALLLSERDLTRTSLVVRENPRLSIWRER